MRTVDLSSLDRVVEQVAQLDVRNDVKEHVDLLCALTWPTTIPTQGIFGEIKERLRRHLWMEYAYARALALGSNFSNRDRASQVDILVTFVPYHENYKALLYPVVEALIDRNVSVGLFAPVGIGKTAAPRNLRCLLFEKSLGAFAIYWRAKSFFRDLRLDVGRLVSNLGLNRTRARATAAFFQHYSWDRFVFARVLEVTCPKVVFGLHFMLTPGYLSALKDNNGLERPEVFLIQHGVLFDQKYHLSFKGADKAILWGESSKDYLPNLSHLPNPEAFVIGNPSVLRLQQEVSIGKAERRENLTVVFAANAESPLDDEWNAEARQLFVSASDRLESIVSVFRSHPGARSIPISRKLRNRGELGRCQLDTESTFPEVLSRADVIVGTFSTALLEAIAVGVPVVQLIPEKLPVVWQDINMVSASNVEQLVDVLSRLESEESFREAVVRQERSGLTRVFGDYENAADRIADLVCESIRGDH